ncbi:cyclase family protein [Nocardia sp. SYP-A9097]|uniref:cyclase family protein n=1 Tax=Nocardia sp. SYP-A9097 TaxID=2663237 RepID=UPI00129A24DA|nr:cyclase family protein [Nocardia sp. SYP-A9097]MRH89303.1 cyclase family protein [Nocardia sp. SYP-A9097]
MCSPRIVQVAHEAAGAPRVSRRAWLGALAGATGAVVASGAGVAVAQEVPVGSGAVVDLTHTLSAELPVWPGNPGFVTVPVAWHDNGGFGQNALAYWEHSGTHIDAPLHRDRNGVSVDRIAAADLVAPLVVIDISARAATDSDAVLTVSDIEAWEVAHGRIPRRAFVAMYSGWERRLATPGAFLNLDGEGRTHAPGFAPAAAEFLVAQRDIVGAGVDTLSLDQAASRDYGAHTAFLGAGRYGVEMLANLAQLPPAGARVIVGAPKHAGGTGGPCRVLALT